MGCRGLWLSEGNHDEKILIIKIAVAGTGYVGLSAAVLLSRLHKVTAIDIIPEKVNLINNTKSPIQDDYFERYLAEKGSGFDRDA